MQPANSACEILLAIETSCDDTAASVVCDGTIRSNIVSSQIDHARYGGVVPEIASRAHQRFVLPVTRTALEAAGVDINDVTYVAATYGPGLAGSLLVGMSFAKAVSAARNIPFLAVNHLDGHLFSPFMQEDGALAQPPFPFLALVVSGGHSELLVVEDWHQRTRLGRTRDDAAGEAFDKVAKLLGLPYPGGPAIERAAMGVKHGVGDPAFVDFPRTTLPDYAFSFSGIKTSVLYHLNGYDEAARAAYLADHLHDLAASFQQAMIEMLLRPVEEAMRATGIRQVALSGGVSANEQLRVQAQALCRRRSAALHVAPRGLRTDNAAMIGLVAYHHVAAGRESPLTQTIDPSAALV